jgi:hypothetical protein
VYFLVFNQAKVKKSLYLGKTCLLRSRSLSFIQPFYRDLEKLNSVFNRMLQYLKISLESVTCPTWKSLEDVFICQQALVDYDCCSLFGLCIQIKKKNFFYKLFQLDIRRTTKRKEIYLVPQQTSFENMKVVEIGSVIQ